jgi:hypothetical protein
MGSANRDADALPLGVKYKEQRTKHKALNKCFDVFNTFTSLA